MQIFRDRELAFKGLKKSDIRLIGGYQPFHSYTKKHIGLDGKTPDEALNVKVDDSDK